ncbi:MAG: molybdopterin molybdotransferase MoeA [Clostridiales bacterium]|nr:molybdopterin molybdotransferase MoeA [Clostridiales bacterium]MDY4182520.1 molybdopterin molybdotransferase MoeA [Pseudoflavonifractor sp.]
MKTRIELEEAVSILEESLSPLGPQVVELAACLGRTLAEDVKAPLDQPPFDRSPLDGYALRSADIAGASRERPVTLTVTETVYAGGVPASPLLPGCAIRIMTGAMLPQGCDCVLQHERTDNGRDRVEIYAALRPHANYCDRGEDYRCGDLLLPAGTRLDAAAVGVLASAGVTEVSVLRRPSVMVFSTGDEIVEPGVRPLPPGKIYGSNAALITARLKELGVADAAGEQLPDQPEDVVSAIRKAAEQYDLIITTGGVSAGDKDIFHQVLPMLGADRRFWKVNLKPGTPAMYSLCGGTPVLSLSGNPFAAAATFELLARPLLAALTGEDRFRAEPAQAVVSGSFPKASPGRRFLRGVYRRGTVSLTGKNDSGMLSSLVGCNCLVDIPAGSGPVEDGQTVRVLLL